jgi:flavin reductase (DIM6/NTAB) family NADH-FMN oxidoreductase RutF
VTIHAGHPFRDPEPDPVRRLRGRFPASVTLWTSGEGDDPFGWAGLTVTSAMVANGEPARVLALLDPDSDLAGTLTSTGRAVMTLLTWEDRGLADVFAGTAPAPGGPFRQGTFEQTTWGPRPVGATSWAGVRLESATEVGWSVLVTCVLEEIAVGDDEPLVHRRGRYLRPAEGSAG